MVELSKKGGKILSPHCGRRIADIEGDGYRVSAKCPRCKTVFGFFVHGAKKELLFLENPR